MPQIPFKLFRKVLTSYRYRVTAKRLCNIVRVYLSMAVSRIFRCPVVWGQPLLLMVEPTNLCNLKCPMCPSGAGTMKRPRGKMDVRKFKKIIDEIGDKLILVQFWNQGEPFIHPDLSEMVSYVKSRAIPAMTSTNGHFFQAPEQVKAIVQSGIDEIIVSFDGIDQETYERYRVGGRFEKVIEGVKSLVQYKRDHKLKRPLLNLQFLVLKHNEDQIRQVESIGRRLGVDLVTLKSVQVYSDNQGREFLPDDERFRRYTSDGKTYSIKSRFPDRCQFLWSGTVVNWDGSVTPCCFDKDGEYTAGNPFQEKTTFREIWKGKKLQSFRKKILTGRSTIPICTNCFEGMRQPYVCYKVL
jgi:radical SAM protein with 4Fe4S-binding SPASM domain